MEKHLKIHKIELDKDDFRERGWRIRVIKVYFNEFDYTCFTVDELMELLRLWIVGEEERYPLSQGYQGRWMLFKEITKVFNENIEKCSEDTLKRELDANKPRGDV